MAIIRPLNIPMVAQPVQGSIDHDPPYPGTDFPFSLPLVQIFKNPYKAFLQYIAGLHGILGIPVANSQHLGRKGLIQLLLCSRLVF